MRRSRCTNHTDVFLVSISNVYVAMCIILFHVFCMHKWNLLYIWGLLKKPVKKESKGKVGRMHGMAT